MKPGRAIKIFPARSSASQGGSLLIIVLWIIFGLVSVTLYFAHTMSFELRASDNRVAGIEAEQAIQGAACYMSLVLSNSTSPGALPDPQTFQASEVAVGDAKFWLIGRTNNDDAPTTAHFGVVDEASKLNINAATADMLALLPRMTPDLAASIVAWRSAATNTSSGGAQSDTYMRLQPPYMCKNAPFETVDELRLIYQMTTDILYGEDANLNGILDANENDGDVTPPSDNQDGRLDPGILNYVTVYSHEPSTGTNGTARVSLATTNQQQILTVLTNYFDTTRAQEILQAAGAGPFTSPLQFYVRSKMTPAEFQQIEGDIRGTNIVGLVNVNTASAAVLACLPGLDSGKAAQLVAARQSNPNTENSIAWVSTALTDTQTINQVGPWITGKSYQFTTDVAAVGHYGRGYRRTRFVFDTTQGTPTIVYRQDLSHLGWALGKETRQTLLAKEGP
ncbi:MAG: ral secretion pathway protein [Pedosphaera sp.]|nr:ral secretion pathway protein [Pedosphaera sp.]